MKIGTVGPAGKETDYFSFGAGRKPLVILPGLSLRSVMLSADTVAASYADLADEWQIFVFDRPRNIRCGYTTEDMASDAAAAFRALGLEKVDLLGVSQGGMIAQHLACREPSLVGSLVLASTSCRPNAVSDAVFTRWIELAEAGSIRTLNHDVFDCVYSEQYREENRDAFLAAETEGTLAEARRFAILARACLTSDSATALEKIGCRTMVIGSDDDRVLTGEASREIADRLGCSIYMYKKYSHAVYDEAPDYHKRLRQFFRAVP